MLEPRHPGPPPADAGAPLAPAGDLWSSGAIVDVILDHLSDAVFATDLDNRVTFWGSSAARLFGYSAAEAVGRPFGELLPYRMAADGDEDAFFATLRAGRTWRGSGSVRLRDGTEVWIESTVQPVRAEGRVIGSVSVSRDMTARREAEHRLIAQERFLDAVLEVMGTARTAGTWAARPARPAAGDTPRAGRPPRRRREPSSRSRDTERDPARAETAGDRTSAARTPACTSGQRRSEAAVRAGARALRGIRSSRAARRTRRGRSAWPSLPPRHRPGAWLLHQRVA
jgi:PAS domain S-box-containing protein